MEERYVFEYKNRKLVTIPKKFRDLQKGNVFIAFNDKEFKNQVFHKDGSDLFEATSNPYFDELGILQIDITTDIKCLP